MPSYVVGTGYTGGQQNGKHNAAVLIEKARTVLLIRNPGHVEMHQIGRPGQRRNACRQRASESEIWV